LYLGGADRSVPVAAPPWTEQERERFISRRCDAFVLANVLEHLVGRPRFLRTVPKASASRALIRVPLFERD
jgi:hypothetical protein